MFVQDTFKESLVPDFDLEQIGEIIETMEEGTLPDKILNLNHVREVSRARPSIEFELKPKFHSLDELAAETAARQPPIAWIWSFDKEKLHKFDNAVLVTGVENGRVYYNDPVFGKKDVSTDDFLAKWDDEDRVLVKVKIGKRTQMLEEFLNGFNKQEQQNVSQGGSSLMEMSAKSVVKAYVRHHYGNLISVEEPKFDPNEKQWVAELISEER